CVFLYYFNFPNTAKMIGFATYGREYKKYKA
ncbi:MAG: hypothetical protein ACI9R6_000467, partial [Saprospiraceae bacterium]